MRRKRFLCGLVGAGMALVQHTSFAEDQAAEKAPEAPAVAAVDGAEIFSREWLPNDPRSHGGDGLGPMFNDSSCVACHNQGGAGGAGPLSKNVDIITAVNNRRMMQQFQQQRATPTPRVPVLPGQPVAPPTLPQQVFRAVFGDVPGQPTPQPSTTQPPTTLPQGPAPGTLPPLTPQPQATFQFTPVQQQAGSFPITVVQQQAEQVLVPTQGVDVQFLPAPGAVPPQVVQAVPQPAVAIGNAEERAEQLRKQQEQDRKELSKLHPGFAFSPSIVLHKDATVTGFEQVRSRLSGMHFGSFQQPNVFMSFDPAATDPAAALVATTVNQNQRRQQATMLIHQLRNQMQVQRARSAQPSRSFQHGNFAITASQRNTTALFGSGLIDAIPVALLEDIEKLQMDSKKSDPKISGRIARLKDGSAGRFGWKAQTASLGEFVMTACAVEVGLNVPDHPQAGVPQKPDYEAPGLDLNQEEVDALIQYITDLPAPLQQLPGDSKAAKWVEEGHKLFGSVGCSECHVEEIGEVAGIFSDLLLHDMGPLLGDTGSYGVFVPSGSPEPVPLQDLVEGRQSDQPPRIVGATRLEWRTPPLWGVRDSAPYMHDGRADTLEQAIALHGGEAEHITQKYFALAPAERLKLISFLKTLSAPSQQTVAQR